MAHYKLSAALTDLVRSLNRTERLAANALRWSLATFPRSVPRFSGHHKELVIELAFLRAFKAWEAFLEESFILYMLGKSPPTGSPPHCLASPLNRTVAERLVSDGREYSRWASVSNVVARAGLFFQDGGPYKQVLASRQYKFDEMNTLRNSIVHTSGSSQRKFEGLVRDELTVYRPKTTVGAFLDMTVQGTSPPQSYLECYLDEMRFSAERIVPR